MGHIEAHGARIPALGLGTWALRGDDARRMVEHALAAGYRHLDTAQMYGNEAEVGAGLRDSGVPRAEVFLTTKIWPDSFRAGDLQAAAAQSVARLGVDAVDLLLLHWPSRDVPLAETLGALDEVADRGLAAHVGVSNFTTALMREAARLARAPLAVNQVEYHPYLDQSRVLSTARDLGMAVVAYSPLAKGAVATDATLARIGEAHGRNGSQVALRWLVQQGVAAIPRTSSEARASANLAVLDFALSDAEMAEIHALARPGGRLVEVSGVAPDWD